MQTYMLIASNGRKNPKYLYHDLSSAITEARRLQAYLGGEVKIVKVIGVVKEQDVPVTKKEITVTIEKGYEEDHLPF